MSTGAAILYIWTTRSSVARKLDHLKRTCAKETIDKVVKDYHDLLRFSFKFTLIMVMMEILVLVSGTYLTSKVRQQALHGGLKGDWRSTYKVKDGRLRFSAFDFDHNYDIKPEEYGCNDYEEGEKLMVLFDRESRVVVNVIKETEYEKANSIFIATIFLAIFGVSIISIIILCFIRGKRFLIWSNYLRYYNGDTSKPFNIIYKYDKYGN